MVQAAGRYSLMSSAHVVKQCVEQRRATTLAPCWASASTSPRTAARRLRASGEWVKPTLRQALPALGGWGGSGGTWLPL